MTEQYPTLKNTPEKPDFLKYTKLGVTRYLGGLPLKSIALSVAVGLGWNVAHITGNYSTTFEAPNLEDELDRNSNHAIATLSDKNIDSITIAARQAGTQVLGEYLRNTKKVTSKSDRAQHTNKAGDIIVEFVDISIHDKPTELSSYEIHYKQPKHPDAVDTADRVTISYEGTTAENGGITLRVATDELAWGNDESTNLENREAKEDTAYIDFTNTDRELLSAITPEEAQAIMSDPRTKITYVGSSSRTTHTAPSFDIKGNVAEYGGFDENYSSTAEQVTQDILDIVDLAKTHANQ